MTAWYASPFTGLFTRFGELFPRAADPDNYLFSGIPAAWNPECPAGEASGIGWSKEAAEAACAGEAIERLQVYPLPDDDILESAFADWKYAEPAIPPGEWVLFHEDQYRRPGFPFEPFTEETRVDWVRCREVETGLPWWVPVDMVYLHPRSGRSHRLAPAVSTGLASGRSGQPIVLRGLQEVLERDAVVGWWWGSYSFEEYPLEEAVPDPEVRRQIRRPNLAFRFFRVVHPISDGVTVVSLMGEDSEGGIFSIGAACRETLAESWEKSLLEAIHGRHYVRYLLRTGNKPGMPRGFSEHAAYFSWYPERLKETVLFQGKPGNPGYPGSPESLEKLVGRLKRSDRPLRVLFRDLTPPALLSEGLDWRVVRVVVPGLQPLHGHHELAHLGGPLWNPRGWKDYSTMPPHPFP